MVIYRSLGVRGGLAPSCHDTSWYPSVDEERRTVWGHFVSKSADNESTRLSSSLFLWYPGLVCPLL